MLGAFILGIGVGLAIAPDPGAASVGAAGVTEVDAPDGSGRPDGGWYARWSAVGGGESPDANGPDSDVAPVRLRVPDIRVDAPVIDLGLDEDRRLEVPATADETGWWTGGAVPGEPGPHVIVGHYDDQTGPAVFHELRHLEPGAEVEIERADGMLVRYRITHLEQHPKDDFPTEAVYGATSSPTLRLVTCGGAFDRAERSYLDNVIAFGEIVAPCASRPWPLCDAYSSPTLQGWPPLLGSSSSSHG